MRKTLAILLVVLGGCGGVDGANNGAGPGNDGSPASNDGLPCDVHVLLVSKCQSCHGASPNNGAPMSLVTAADLMHPSIADPGETFAQIAVLRMQNDATPMPPPPNARATSAEIAAMQNWIAAGYPIGCNGNQMPDAGNMNMPDSGGTGPTYADDFEAYSGPIVNAQMVGPWHASVSGVTMTVDTVRPHSGTKSLHITVAAGATAHGTLGQTATSGLVSGNNLFGRAMVYYDNTGGNNLPLNVHSWLFNASGMSTEAAGGVSMNMGGGGAKMQLNYHPPAPATEQSMQGGMITAGAWHCVQWQYDGSGTPPSDTARVWVDGMLALSIPATKGWMLATPWTTFAFGFTHYQTTTNPVEVFLDDFALGPQMIACP